MTGVIAAVIDNAVGSVIVTTAVVVHKLLSVTVAVKVPAVNPVAVAVD